MAVENKLTFWDHLDELRSCIIRMLLVTLLVAVILFLFKETLFDIVLAPKESDFITYRLLNQCAQFLSIESKDLNFHIDLINTQLASQFLVHMKVAFLGGLFLSMPYLLYSLYRYVSPALYLEEKNNTRIVVVSGYILFIIGILLSYFLLFPLTFRFLGTYQVSADVQNTINLESYIDLFFILCMGMGILFEIPIVAWLLAKFGIINSSLLKNLRRHAFVVILIIAAILTPTSDPFTLSLVSGPLYLLYELSILIVSKTQRKGE